MDLVRVRETHEPLTTFKAALPIVGHERAPAGGRRGVIVEDPPVHVAVGVGRRPFAATIVAQQGRFQDARRISVVGQAHEVAQLMDKCAGTAGTARDGKRIGRGGVRRRQPVGIAAGAGTKQHDDVRGNPVAGAVDHVEVAVRGIVETTEISQQARPRARRRARLRVPHLLDRCEHDPLVHPARPEGQVGLRGHEVDLGLDRGGAAGVVPGGRRVEDGRVDDRLRLRRADQPAEGDRRRPVLKGGVLGRAQLGAGQIHRRQRRQLAQAGRERAGQMDVAVEKEGLEPGQVPQRRGQRPAQAVVPELEPRDAAVSVGGHAVPRREGLAAGPARGVRPGCAVRGVVQRLERRPVGGDAVLGAGAARRAQQQHEQAWDEEHSTDGVEEFRHLYAGAARSDGAG